MPHKRKRLNIAGENLWYFIGLITSDGSLSKDGRHINITSKDKAFLEQLKNTLGLSNRIGVKNRDKINKAYQLQLANIEFYNFLLSIGLTPNKSLTQKELSVPEDYFQDFQRGLIDGDGCIRRWLHPTNRREQWSLRIYSGSKEFLEWLKAKNEKIFRVSGKLYREKSRKCFILKYGKLTAQVILKRCYYNKTFGLQRKVKLAYECINSYVGWKRSKCVLAAEAN